MTQGATLCEGTKVEAPATIRDVARARTPRISFCANAGGVVTALRDYLIEFLRDHGRDVSTLPPNGRLSDIGDILFSVNFVPDMARLAAAIRRPYIAWLSSPWLNPLLNDPSCVSDYTIMFHFARGDMEKSRRLGYRHVYYLPRSIDLRPFLDAPRVGAGHSFDVSFVGNCYHATDCAYRSYVGACRAHRIPPAHGVATLEAAIAGSLSDLTTPLWALFIQTVRDMDPGFIARMPLPDGSRASDWDTFASFVVDHLLSHEIDLRLRQTFVNRLADLGMHVWGDAHGWLPLPHPAIEFHGRAGKADMAGIMRQSSVCMNLPRRCSDGIIFRHYEIPAAGGFQMALFSPDVAQMFEADKEIVFFRTLEEVHEKCEFYLRNEGARTAIAEAGNRRLLRDHTMEHRFGEMRRILKTIGVEL